MLVGELEALLTSEKLPVALPVAVGANCRLRLLDCPGESVRGNACPLILKIAPLTVAWETVRLALPELLKVRVCVLVVPTSTSPKATLPGVVDRVAGLVPCVTPVTNPEQLDPPTIADTAASAVRPFDNPRRKRLFLPADENTHPLFLSTRFSWLRQLGARMGGLGGLCGGGCSS
jgi:hypothetical protein